MGNRPPPRNRAAAGGDESPSQQAGSTPDLSPEAARYVLVLYQGQQGRFSSLHMSLVAHLRRLVEDGVAQPRENVELDLWLESPGGDAHAAYKLALLLRAHASRLRVVIPDYAKSAATLLTLAADEIYMAPAAELGPLDAQVPHEQEGMTISALDVARSLEDLATTAMDMALAGGGSILQMTRLSRSESMSAMLDFAAKFMQPLVGKLDPKMIHWASSLLDVSVRYGDQLLAMRHQNTSPTAAELAGLPRRLVEGYPAHGFVIGSEEASRLRLPIKDASMYPRWKEASALHRSFEDSDTNLVELLEWGQLDGDN
jgi:Serine dehydrogenase proteinase